MTVSRVVRGAALGAMALLAVGAAAQGTRQQGKNWNTEVVETNAGHRIGNPAAALKLTEYISYTCPHCAAFAREGEGAMQMAFVGPGRVSVEVRHLIRDPIDLTAVMLTHCGAPAKFPQNHSAFMLNQASWIAPLSRATPAQEQRWRTAGAAGRRAIASDFGFYAIMERRGYSRVEVDRCLADDALAKKLAETSAADWKRPGISGTPAFAIDGNILAGTHSWSELEPQLSARF